MLVCGMVLCTTASQIFFKKAAEYSLALDGLAFGWILNPWLLSALLLSVLGAGFWIVALKRLPLSAAYPWTASVYVLTPIMSTLVFHEHISLKYFAGLFLICSGVFFASRGTKPSR